LICCADAENAKNDAAIVMSLSFMRGCRLFYKKITSRE